MPTDIICIRLQCISLGRNHRFAIHSIESFCQQIALSVIFTFCCRIVTTEHIRHTGLIKVFFTQQTIISVIFATNLCSSSINISHIAISTEIDLASGITIIIIFTNEGSIAIRTFDRLTIFIKIFFTELVTFSVPFILLFMVTVRNFYRLILDSIIGNTLGITHIIGFSFLCSITKGRRSRFPVSV